MSTRASNRLVDFFWTNVFEPIKSIRFGKNRLFDLSARFGRVRQSVDDGMDVYTTTTDTLD